MAVVTETALPASHLPSSIAPFFCFPSWRNFLESVCTSCLYFLTFCSLSSPFQPGFHPPTQLKRLLSSHRHPLCCQVCRTRFCLHLPQPLRSIQPSWPQPPLERLYLLSLHESMSMVSLLPLWLPLLNFFACFSFSAQSLKFLRAQSGSGWHHS